MDSVRRMSRHKLKTNLKMFFPVTWWPGTEYRARCGLVLSTYRACLSAERSTLQIATNVAPLFNLKISHFRF